METNLKTFAEEKDKIEPGTPPHRVWENLKENLVLIISKRTGYQMPMISMAASIIIIAGVFFWIDKEELIEHHNMAKVHIPQQPGPASFYQKPPPALIKNKV